MEKLSHAWYRVPGHVRKPIVFIVGMLFIIAAVLTGWLPGPGGIPLFLIGIAILASEFEWARRFRDKVLRLIKRASVWFRQHRQQAIAGIIVAASLLVMGLILYFTS